jgi:hypothetical protein
MKIDHHVKCACSLIVAIMLGLIWSSDLSAGSENVPLEIKVQFFYETDNKEIKPLSNESVLKSGQNVGVAFRAKENCFIYIFWNDTSENMGMLFPNPRLTEPIPQVVAEKTYWLPHKDGERWYVLDENPGTETIYFVVSRNRNAKLEELSKIFSHPFSGARDNTREKSLSVMPTDMPQAGGRGSSHPDAGAAYSSTQPGKPETTDEIKRQLNLMGFARHSLPKGAQKTSFASKEEIFRDLETRIRTSDAEALFKIQFRHM